MTTTGHNAQPLLEELEQRGRRALQAIAKGEGKALDHWVELGIALRDGRELHADNKAFGKWKASNIYSHVRKVARKPDANTEVACMWMCSNPDQLTRVRKQKPSLYAPRKLHDAFKAMVDEVLKEGDWSDEEQLHEATADVGATPEDVAAAQAREAARREREAQKLADQTAAEELAKAQAEAELEARVQMLAAERIEAMLTRLPEELQAQVRAALSTDGQLLEPPAKPKRAYRRKAKVEDAEVIDASPEAA